METPKKKSTEKFVKDIRKHTRRIFTSEQKILIVMEGLRAETSVAELCRKHNIVQSQFYSWNKEFMEAGKKRLSGDITREATSDEVSDLKKENARLKEIVADLVLRYDIVKKSSDMLDQSINTGNICDYQQAKNTKSFKQSHGVKSV